MNKFNLLGKSTYKINDYITIRIPKVGDIWGVCDNQENKYLSMLSFFIQTPTDVMIELDNVGIDWTQVKEYELFVLYMSTFLLDIHTSPDSIEKWNLLFQGLDCKDIFASTDNTGKAIFVNSKEQIIFNEKMYNIISDLICSILITKKNRDYAKVPEIETRRYILERARIKRERYLTRLNNGMIANSNSILDGIILFLVNNCNFKYDFETVKKLSVYDLYACYKQINKNQEIDGLMTGYWYGNVDLSKISDSKLKRIIL